MAYEEIAGVTALDRPAQKLLEQRVRAAYGEVAPVVHEIELQIEELDRGMRFCTEPMQQRRRADRTFFLHQLAYLHQLRDSAERFAPPSRRIARQLRAFVHQFFV